MRSLSLCWVNLMSLVYIYVISFVVIDLTHPIRVVILQVIQSIIHIDTSHIHACIKKKVCVVSY